MSRELGSPVRSADRISSLDVIRGAALLGILLMNIVGFGLPLAYNDPDIAGGADGLNFLTWQITSLFFEGTMRGLFSLLFGAGIVLMTSRAEARDPSIAVADIYFRRNLWLIAFGLVHAWLLLFPADILYRYGVVALFLFVFRKVSPKTLIVLGVLVLATTTMKDIYWNIEENNAQAAATAAQTLLDSGEDISDEQQDAIDDWPKCRRKTSKRWSLRNKAVTSRILPTMRKASFSVSPTCFTCIRSQTPPA